MRRLALGIALSLALPAAAKVVNDGSVGPAGLVGEGVIGTTHVDYLITPDHGTLRDTNLFFSFSDFSIESQKIAAFTGPATVQNVLARVTGGDASRIDGTLGSTITGADVWLVNPSGVIFGAGAELSVRGAFHASTGSYIRLADGSIFSAADSGVGGLTVAAPEAFGFLGGEAGAIDIDVSGSALRGRAFERFSLVGGDVSIHAGLDDQVGFVWAQNGRIDLVGVASDGSAPVEVALYDDGVETLDVTGPWQGRALVIDRQAVLSSSGVSPAGPGVFQQGAGDVHVLGESLTVDVAEIHAETGGSQKGGDIRIDLRGDLVLRAREDRAASLATGSGVRFGNAQIVGLGDGGDISIRAQNVFVLDGAQMTTTSLFLGDAGNVEIDARDTVRIDGRRSDGEISGIFSRTEVQGDGGRIVIGAQRLELDHGGALVTETLGVGAGGSIFVDVAKLSILGDGRIDSSTRSFSDPPGDGGTIRINATDSVRISGRSSDESFSGITAIAQGATDTRPESTGRAGEISVRTPLLRIGDGGEISTAANGSGDGGPIEIDVQTLRVKGGFIRASAKAGQGGTISIDASRSASFIGGSEVSARASGAGDAGSIEIDGGEELRIEDSAITAESEISNGAEIRLRARKLLELHRGEVSTSVGGGLGGDIDIDPEYVVLNDSRIVAQAGSGSGGNIRIVAGQFVSDASSTVDASSQTGIDGSVSIDSPEVDQNSALDVLPSDYADAGTLLRAACAARTGAGAGTFVVRTGARTSAAPDAPLGADDAAEDDCAR
jgi:filamentous hemagglutinin family protein